MPEEPVLREHVYLVARGVRLLAHIGWCERAEAAFIRSALARVADGRVLSFVIEEDDAAVYGFASHAWAVDLYRWARLHAPTTQRDRGLLLGYMTVMLSDGSRSVGLPSDRSMKRGRRMDHKK